MGDDLVSLIIYLALALVGIIASAYKNRSKRQQSSRSGQGEVQGSYPADPEKDYEPELGPLMELFDIQKPKQEPYEYESVENGPSVEEEGMIVDSQVSSVELAGYNVDTYKSTIDNQVSEVESFEEGQSDIQKMIAKYEATRKEMEDDPGLGDDIASGEIVSVEAEEAAKMKRLSQVEFFDARKAIIYSEILKRKEY